MIRNVLRSAWVWFRKGLLRKRENLLDFIPLDTTFSGNDVTDVGHLTLIDLYLSELFLSNERVKFFEIPLERRFYNWRVVGVFSISIALPPVLNEAVILNLHHLCTACFKEPEPL